ncbi:MAG TPA: hypothetical protein VF092_16055 [Longimicrobium sp.]
MTTDEARVDATRRTYARRAARRAADELAGVSIDLWDDATKRIVAALAAHIPSKVTAEELDDAFGPIGPRLFSWDELPHGTEDIHVAFAAELDRMGLTADEVDDERERDEAAAAEDAELTPEERASVAEAADRNAAAAADDAELDEREAYQRYHRVTLRCPVSCHECATGSTPVDAR